MRRLASRLASLTLLTLVGCYSIPDEVRKAPIRPDATPTFPSTGASMAVADYFEIPVTDLDRAMAFYVAVLGVDFERGEIDGHPMAFFPSADGRGANGTLVTGQSYVPSVDGTRVYFSVRDLDAVLDRARAQGAEVLYPKTSIGEHGHVAEIKDSEGNRVALVQRP